jgi:N-acetylglucosaminyldiphosphoundecaprenol N-acetyl-beta-D-mannosaminyltransferase
MKFDFLGIPVSRIDAAPSIVALIEQYRHGQDAVTVTFINPYAYFVKDRWPDYLAGLSRFNYVLCDGVGVVKAAHMLGESQVVRLSFDSTSLAPGVFSGCVAKGLSVYLVGGADGVADQAAQIIHREWGCEMVGATHGFHRDWAPVYQDIVNSGASVVVCGMGAPYQESFVLGLVDAGWKGIGFTCGGYFDQLCEKGRDYYPHWVDKMNFRSLYRLWMEPGRLWKRYFLEYRIFYVAFIAGIFSRLFRKA